MNKQLLPIILFSLILSGCGGPFLDLNFFVLDEQTSLEKQVLGSYSEIGSDLTAYSSVRGVSPDGSMQTPPEKTSSQQQAFNAMRNQRYNSDDVNRLLSNRIVGEGNEGLLVLEESVNPAFGLTMDQVDQLIEEENRDRQILIDRLMETTVAETSDKRREVAWIFAQINQETAPAGTRIQMKNGEWKTK